MEKQKLLMNEGVNSTASAPTWNSCNFGLEILSTELNCGSEQLNTNSFFNPNWETSMDQSDPFESALSSIVSSPAASNASVIPGATGDNVMIRELIGRLGNICNSGEILPQSYIQVQTNNNNSSNTSCYSTPLNSPPKLNLSMTDSQIRGNMPIPGNQLPNHPNLAPLAADPGFAERAARLSCFGSRNFDGLNGLSDIELSQRMIHRSASGKLSRVSSSQSMKAAGSQVNVHQENNNRSRSSLHPQDGNSGSDKKFKSLSRSSTPDNADFGDSKEESSVSEQIPGGDLSSKAQHDANARKRKSVLRAKAKETSSSSPPTKDAKVVGENEESNSKRSKKQDETKGNGNDNDKAKAEEAASAKTVNDGSQKQNKDNSKLPEPPKDYIHVRARRGQATDSHSLAERVRREKISERMKFLQDLVPGCNKVTGKAVMLDEIINYVQSLQRQVEFLSMKLATVNPRMDFNMEALLSKDMFQSRGYMPNSLYPIDSTTQTFPFGYQPQQGLPLTSGITNNAAENQFPINQLNSALRRSPNMQLPSFNGYGEVGYQVPSILEDDLQSLVQMVFDQNQPQSFNDSMATAQMKIEM